MHDDDAPPPPPIPIHIERHRDGAVSLLLLLGGRAITLDATERGPVLTRVFDHNASTGARPKTAEAELDPHGDDEDLADVIAFPTAAPFLPEAA